MPYFAKGAPYTTKQAAAAAIGMQADSLLAYAKRHGITFQEALDTYKKPESHVSKAPFFYGGHPYQTQREAADACPVAHATLKSWMRKYGYTFQEALDAIPNHVETHTYCGNVDTLSNILQSLGISRGAFRQYCLRNDFSIQQGLDNLVDGKFPDGLQPVLLFGIEYPSVAKALEDVGEEPRLFYNQCAKLRISSLEGLRLFECGQLDISRKCNARVYTVGRDRNLPFIPACKAAHISPKRVRNIHEQTGIPIQDILCEAYSAYMKDLPPYLVDGISFAYRRDVSEYLNISPSHFSNLVRQCGTVAAAVSWYKQHNTTFNRLFSNIYVGRDGKLYYSHVCRECGRSLVLSGEEATTFQHSETFCKEHSI